MLEAGKSSSVNGGNGREQSCWDNGEEEVSALSRHTKVVVTGNNRTKSVLVGLHGVVKSVGLGGWHWLVLTNGIEVKLQRNALSVIEAPTGREEDDEMGVEWNGSDVASECTQRSPRQKHKSPRTMGSSNRTLSPSHSCGSQPKGPTTSSDWPTTRVDLGKLKTTALWRYWRHFNLVGPAPGPTLSKEQLIMAVQRHFTSQQLDELQVIAGFIQAARRLRRACTPLTSSSTHS
ncbi:unnamed protein product [Spirodela intermedia]|uniref:Histone deacetylase complex subunit SAP30 Sin3 binding domain-containing protein n=2 Tax=Spirodela intermedia TaxID=51605 RepID=A0A7I8L4U6_SPIIN|nr:unnamed protein product [Spirodela intermedia]CAA6667421.1 unnamed protein product [Spirodela intermedia]CAA7404254.1 unnamed protein product [Spirodela intermedia]